MAIGRNGVIGQLQMAMGEEVGYGIGHGTEIDNEGK